MRSAARKGTQLRRRVWGSRRSLNDVLGATGSAFGNRRMPPVRKITYHLVMTTGDSDHEPDLHGEADAEETTSGDAEVSSELPAEAMSNHERAERLKRGAKRGLQFGRDLFWELGRRRDK